jgi:phenylalanyl-tRNA synthetase alpha chain
MLREKIKDYLKNVEEFQGNTLEEVEKFRIKYLGRKGIVKDLMEEFKTVENKLKPELGKHINELKKQVSVRIETVKSSFTHDQSPARTQDDYTKPTGGVFPGSRHPVSLVREQIIDIFSRIGFTVSYGPEIEDDWHNFSALNFPEEHPARDMQDTFFLDSAQKMALRTHTSSVQVRVMENQSPPIRTISPGRVFRNEAISARAHCIFHQVEGLYIDKGVSFADLKQTLLYFARELFGSETQIRLRPSYFPFTEPSAEMDIYWGLNSEADYRVTKGTGWLEILGCGMVDPNVLRNNSIDPSVYSGFAFGMGIERIAMLKYQVKDLRMFFENDIRFLNQFTTAF